MHPAGKRFPFTGDLPLGGLLRAADIMRQTRHASHAMVMRYIIGLEGP